MRNKLKIIKLLSLFISLLTISSCTSQTEKVKADNNTNIKKENNMKNTKEIIVDVRTPEEWEFDGHADCSVNYPLDQLENKIEELKAYEHVVLVCRSGNRAGHAKRMLESAGIKNVENMGAWQNIGCAN
ncbi:MAG: rhodanese-like domain-containing protein [Bacteroidia bacterium]|nr:rhodanese-like domain-containing protein [Bacteroidia bacterium]